MGRSDRSEADLAELLDSLDATLEELRRDLVDEADVPSRQSNRSSRRIPQPPSVSELLRFTEEYTIPTVIALLEVTVEVLELLQGLLRLAGPGPRDTSEAGARKSAPSSDRILRGASERAADDLVTVLRDLRTALTEADLPDNPESRSIIEEARELSAEIERRIEEGGVSSRDGEPGTPSTGAVTIEVDKDEDQDSEADGETGDASRGPDVDVESELRSIKDDLNQTSDGNDSVEDDADSNE